VVRRAHVLSVCLHRAFHTSHIARRRLSVYNRRLEEWKIWQARWDAAQHRADVAAKLGEQRTAGRADALQLGT
jgi:hypothetical protein